MNLLKDKVIIITGATSGIGAGTAIEAAEQGASVVLAGRRAEMGEAVVDKIKAAGGKALFVQTDVTKEDEVKNLVAQTVKHYGRLDGAYNNAGITHEATLVGEATLEFYKNIVDTNMLSIFLCMRYEIEAMKENGGGSIVNCSSISGTIVYPGYGIYAASKSGLNGLSKAAAIDHATDNIRVNYVLPGVTYTEIWDTVPNGRQLLKEMTKDVPLQRYAVISEIAKPVIFLLSDWASYITATELVIDGGFVVR